MRKIFIPKGIIIGISLIFLGCSSTSPQPNLDQTRTVKIGGASFRILAASNIPSIRMTTSAVKAMKKRGIMNCKEGDLAYSFPFSKNNLTGRTYIVTNIVKSRGKIIGYSTYFGCTSPI